MIKKLVYAVLLIISASIIGVLLAIIQLDFISTRWLSYGRFDINDSDDYFSNSSEFLIKKEALIEIGGFIPFKNAWGSDDATWINLISKKGIIASSPKILCNYRFSNVSITSITDPSPKLLAISQFNKWFLDFFSKNYNNLLSYSDKDMVESIPVLFENRINKRKRDALSNSKSALFIISYWLKNRKKFTLTLGDLQYSLAKYFFKKKVITKY